MTIEVIIDETGETESLSMRHAHVEDVIGNWGGLDNAGIIYDREAQVYRCTQDTYEWWSAKLDELDRLEERISDLVETYGFDAVHRVLFYRVEDNDLDDYPRKAHEALDEEFGSRP